MSRQPPTQELVAKDLHGNEWRFRHIFRGIIPYVLNNPLPDCMMFGLSMIDIKHLSSIQLIQSGANTSTTSVNMEIEILIKLV